MDKWYIALGALVDQLRKYTLSSFLSFSNMLFDLVSTCINQLFSHPSFASTTIRILRLWNTLSSLLNAVFLLFRFFWYCQLSFCAQFLFYFQFQALVVHTIFSFCPEIDIYIIVSFLFDLHLFSSFFVVCLLMFCSGFLLCVFFYWKHHIQNFLYSYSCLFLFFFSRFFLVFVLVYVYFAGTFVFHLNLGSLTRVDDGWMSNDIYLSISEYAFLLIMISLSSDRKILSTSLIWEAHENFTPILVAKSKQFLYSRSETVLSA